MSRMIGLVAVIVGWMASDSPGQQGASAAQPPAAPAQSRPPTATQPLRSAATQAVRPPAAASRPAKRINRPPNRTATMDQPIRGAGFVCEHPYHDFGEVWQNANVAHRFEIKNTGTSELQILEVKADCHCTVPDKYDRSIPAGKSGFVTFTLHTAGLGNWLSKGASIKTNDPRLPNFRVLMEGLCKTVVTMTPNSANFLEITSPDAEIIKDLVLESNVDEPLLMELMPITRKPPPPFALRMETLEVGRKWQIKIKTVPPLPAGYNTHSFVFKTGHKEIPVWQLTASFFRPERVAAKPMNLRLPDRLSAADPKPSVDLFNHGEKPVKALSASIPNEELLAATIVEMLPGRQYRIDVSAPEGYVLPGAIDMIVKTDDPDFPEVKVPIWSMASRGKSHPKAPPKQVAINRPPASAPAGGAPPARMGTKAESKPLIAATRPAK